MSTERHLRLQYSIGYLLSLLTGGWGKRAHDKGRINSGKALQKMIEQSTQKLLNDA